VTDTHLDSTILLATVSGILLLPIGAAQAQRADSNVVTEADDAFGLSLNGQSLGLYNSRNIRNSDPVLLGNLRLEGLYFDRQGSFTSQLVDMSSVRVGIGTIDFPFPAPAGIVDFRIRDIPASNELALTVGAGRFLSPYVDVDVARSLVPERLSVTGGVSVNPRDGTASGGVNGFGSAALNLESRPTEDVMVAVFANQIWSWRVQGTPIFYVDGERPPPPPRRIDISQEWAHGRGSSSNAGIRADWLPAGPWSVRSGLFYSERAHDESFDTIFTDVDAAGRGTQLVSAYRDHTARSLSGENQVRYAWSSGRLENAVDGSLLGRYVVRRFGGEELLDLGMTDIYERHPVPEPVLAGNGPLSRDSIFQWMVGLRYRAELSGWGLLSAGIQSSRYAKQFRSRMESSASTEQQSSDILSHATLAAPIGHGLAVYASYAEGLQEGGIAPADAVNRYQMLAMIKSSQVDGGVRFLRGGTMIDVAAFAEEKPYAGTDAESVYRLIGSVRNRGVEASVSTQPVSDLKLVAGLLLLEPDLTIDDVVDGRERRAIGVPTRKGQLNADYKLSWLGNLSVDARIDYSAGVATSTDRSFTLPAEITLDLGLRFPFELEKTRFVSRLQVTNVFDQFSWHVDGHGGFTYSAPRTFTLAITSTL
jgi:iron complex outermembrane receptor protein